MADTVQITAGSGTTIGTDEVTIGATSQHVQRMKLVDGADGGTDLIPGSAARGLAVDPRPKAVILTATPVISTTAYAIKDAVGGLLTFANAARSSGGGLTIMSAQLVDKAQQLRDLELVLFDRSITAPTDNLPFDPTDTEIGYCVGVIPFSAGFYSDFNDNSVATVTNIGLHITLNGTDLYGVLVARSTPTYPTTSDLAARLEAIQD